MKELLERIRSGIEFLKARLPFRVDDLYWGIDNDGYLNVTGASHYSYFENLTKENCLTELEEIKGKFFEMTTLSVELKNFSKEYKLKFNLDFDYGMGDVRVCSEFDGKIVWYSKEPR